MAHDVFISYSHQDKPTADAVCALLEANGVRCWIASRDIAPGAEWAESIIEAIGNSRVMVLLFTARSNASPQVRKEVERAVNKGVTLIPLRIEDVTPSRSLEYFLSTPHWLDALTPPLEKHVHRLAKRIVALLSEDGTTAPPPSSPSITTPAPRMRRLGRAAWVGIVIVFAGSGVLTVYLQRHPLRGSNSPSSVPAPAGMAAASTGSIPAHPTTGQAPTSGVRSGQSDLSSPAVSMPKNPQAAELFRQAIKHMTLDELDQAIAQLDEVIFLEPDFAPGYLKRAQCQNDRMNWKQAAVDANRAIELGLQNDTAYRARGAAYLNLGDFARAGPDLEQAIGLNPNDADNYWNRALFRGGRGREEEALADLDKTIELNPRHVAALNNRSVIHLMRGNFDRALADTETVLGLYPDNLVALVNRAAIYNNRGDYPKGVADLDRAVQLSPANDDVFLRRGQLYFNMNQGEKAVTDFSEAIRLNQKNATAYFYRSKTLSKLGEKDRAHADYEQAITLDPRLATP